MRAPWRTGGIAIVLVTAAWASTARAGSSTTMTVDSARDNRTASEYDDATLQVIDLNNVAEDGYVRVWHGLSEWWEARCTDPYPVDIPGGSELTSVVVTVQYLMEDSAWEGALIVDARKGPSISLDFDDTMSEYASATQETWDITSAVNGELDPLDTLNQLVIRMINNDHTGPGVKVMWSYVVVDVGFNAAPYQPSFVSPGIDEGNVSRNPSLTASGYGHMEPVTHQDSDWEIFADSGPVTRVAYRLADSLDKTSIAVTETNFTFENSLAGKIALLPNTEYWARVRYRDVGGLVSDWSVLRHFTTGVGSPPSPPSITAPGSGETDVSRRPTITADAFSDPEGDAHASSDWEVFESPGPADRVAFRLADDTNLTSIDVTVANVTFEGTLAGMTSLAPSEEYWVRVTYRDEYGPASTSSAVNFTTADNLAPDVPSITSPSGTGVSRSPTVTASGYNDQDFDVHASSDWEILDVSMVLVASSMNDSVNLESIDVTAANMVFGGALQGRGSLDPDTDYWVRVTYRDTYGGEATSPTAQFTTGANVAPAQASIRSPAADQANVPLNPIVAADPYSDPDGDRHLNTDWELYGDAALTDLVASSIDDAKHLVSISMDATSVTFEGGLSVKGSLAPATDYWVRARFKDDLGEPGAWSEARHFQTGNYPEGEEWPFFGSGCSPGPGLRRRRPSTAAFGGTCLALWLCAGVLFRRRRASH